MGDPISTGIMGAIGLGTSLIGGMEQGKGQQAALAANMQQLIYQAGISQQNAAIMKQNMQYALQTGESQAQQVGMAQRAAIGGIRTAEGASGFQIGKGTMPSVLASQRMIGGMQQAATRATAAKAAYDFDIQAYQQSQQAQAQGIQAENIGLSKSTYGLASTLGTVGGVASKWFDLSKSGAFGGTPGVGGAPGTSYLSNVGSELSGIGSNISSGFSSFMGGIGAS